MSKTPEAKFFYNVLTILTAIIMIVLFMNLPWHGAGWILGLIVLVSGVLALLGTIE